MQEGRAAKAAERAAERRAHYSFYSEWVKEDAAQFRRYRSGEITHDQWRSWVRANPMPELPTSKEEA